MDADERLSPELETSIKSILKEGSSFAGYKIWRKNYYPGVWIRHCGWHSPVIRLFKRGKGRPDMKYVHESILISGEIGNPIFHYSYKNIEWQVERISLYSNYDARVLYEKGLRITNFNALWYCGLKPLLIFVRKYIFLGGILEGPRGFIISVFTGMVAFLNYAKVRSIQIRTATQTDQEKG